MKTRLLLTLLFTIVSHNNFADPNEDLISAVKNEDIIGVKLALNQKADIDTTDYYGQTAVMIALNEDFIEIANFLFSYGADVSIKRNDGFTTLMAAIENGHYEIARLLISKGADVNPKNEEGGTALAFAVYRKNLAIVKLLISNGTDINIKGDTGVTVLFLAVASEEIFKYLISNGADVNAKGVLKFNFPIICMGILKIIPQAPFGKGGERLLKSPLFQRGFRGFLIKNGTNNFTSPKLYLSKSLFLTPRRTSGCCS